MGFIVLRHGENRDECDTALRILTASGALIHPGQVRVHVTRITTAARHFLTCSGNLTQRFRVVCDIRDDDEYVHALVKRQVFRGGERHTRRGNTLNGGVVCEVHKHDRTVDRTGAAEVVDEEVRLFKCDADCGENDSKLAGIVENLCLTRDLRGKVGMRQAGPGEDRQLLSTDERI